jgi:3-dehydroquinate dehydratase II
MKILIINGPNLNLILLRNKDFYGNSNLDTIKEMISGRFPEVETTFFTSNIEGEIITRIQESDSIFDGIIINAGAFTHNSIGIRDALEICKLPKVEVHLSNLAKRDNFRNVFITTSNCDGYISGFKEMSYLTAVFAIFEIIKKNNNS